MNVEDAIRSRRAIRSYKDKEISEGKLEEIIDAVRMAPSASNKQDWRFVFVTEGEKKEKLFEKANVQDFVKDAPVIVAGVTTDPEVEMTCGVPAGVVDLSIALDHLTLKAAEEGLGTCWIATFDQEKTKEVLEIPNEYRVIEIMTLGYPAEPLKREDKDRKELEKIMFYNNFSESK
ncbi:hypothetical protein AKJ52_01400 [candidate division MSBL1 archaeon SCGC-AAA382C18]|uniref:Nitroreductase domain-containing protein n=1 Tax=candidate division MSBL1 archaeon SCGC-AAA382C18 TaxID=1698281 RepID=A0A133VKC0_9EURY|nr:hypothetical protein AKJ52_01400 [candidate division MSBL1 archaeon SCGC-AAA382C18]